MATSTRILSLCCLPVVIACAGEPHDASEVDTPLTQPSDDPSLVTMPASGPRSAEEQADLDRLAALEVVEVGALLARYPAGALNCYGVCPGFEDEVEQANAMAAMLLTTLADLAQSKIEANASVAADVCEPAAIEANLAALRALEIVEVGEFLALVPENNPSCYNLPCPEDSAAAELGTCERAAKLARIVEGL